MHIESLSRTLLVCLLSLVLTACGGGGGGGGDDLIIGGGGGGDGSGDGSGGGTSSGTITLTISGMVDANGDPDNVLAGNEVATLTAEVTENGQPAELVVLFSTTIGRLLQDSAQANGGSASVQIEGDGQPGAATVTASATLSDGTDIETSITVQTSADAPTLVLLDSTGEEAETVELRAAETADITARLTDWDNTPLSGIGVTFSATALTVSEASGQTDANGDVTITLTGTETAASGELTATATFGSFSLDDSINANSLGVNTDQNNLTMSAIDAGSDGVLDGNEKILVSVTVLEDGVARDGISVTFTTNGGSLTNASATTGTATYGEPATPGVARAQLVGDGVAGNVTVTADATLTNGIAVSDSQAVQTSAITPSITLLVKNKADEAVTEFGANQELNLEATVVDYDGSTLEPEDAGAQVTFDIGTLGTLVNDTVVTEFEQCPVNNVVKDQTDCATVPFTSNAVEAVGTFSATATINGIVISDSLTVTNTGQNSGAPDQNSFTITRIQNDLSFSVTDTLALEGDIFNNDEATVRVDLADFFNNPVPDGTLVEFTAELGDIASSCETAGGSCDVIYFSADPRAPDDTEVSFRQLDVDDCPSSIVRNETVSVSGGQGQTDYRVQDIMRLSVGSTVMSAGSDYEARSYGFECLSAPCSNGATVTATYRRLWLDEEDDGATTHLLLNPGQATEPFLDVRSTPCLAAGRDNVERLTGAIDPDGTTSVTGVGTLFELELAVGDRLKVGEQVSTITAIASDTSLTVDSAFDDGGNDVSPERIAAPAYLGGMGQPYGARSTILAYAIGEESFVDVNGNDEYDFGEPFDDLTEAFLDKNEDGVLNDINGDSATAGTYGPYRDAGLGTAAPGEAREKTTPECYGPQTIVGDATDGAGDSTEAQVYCYQDGGEEELFIDRNGNGVMDVGNGIYNGSRCLNPEQDVDGVLTTVCTTELVNISRDVQILLAGSIPVIEFRAGDGGANGGGEIIQSVELAGGSPILDTTGSPPDWTISDATAVLGLTVQKGADVDTTNTDLGVVRDVELVNIEGALTTSEATWTLEFQIEHTDINSQGGVEVFASGQKLTFDNGFGSDNDGDADDSICGESAAPLGAVPVIDVCRVSGFSVGSSGDLIIASADSVQRVIAEINKCSDAACSSGGAMLTGTTTGNQYDFEITNGETVTSNDLTDTALTQFDVGAGQSTIDADGNTSSNITFAGVSEVNGNGGNVPRLSTTRTGVTVYFTDRYNGQLPEGTVVTVSSDNSAGCTLASVNGVAVNSNDPGPDSGGVHSGEVTIGTDVSFGTGISLTTGFGAGTVLVSVTTPTGTTRTEGFTCQL
ncbi:MAG: Ig-like domain-containing protein [Pseudomonadales bacterium]|nr:Ig-like domain-containing protein [Pseudomonadales bacterium]MBO6597979.1 Ig-like domain-containing protein [Pseudomonadales bacterium]MBO6822999.1 Ig-like domain-containing protein [Pseudomonadales bacterium]